MKLGDVNLETVGALSLAESFNLDLAATLLDGDPMPEVEFTLAVLHEAGWLAPVEDGWRWVAEPRERLRCAFVTTFPGLATHRHGLVADWYSAHEQPSRALRHAVTGRCWTRVTTIAETHWPTLLLRHPGRLARTLRQTPLSALAASPLTLALRELLGLVPAAPMPLPPLLSPPDRRAIGRSPQARHAVELNLAALIVLRRRGDYARAQAYSEQVNTILIAASGHRPKEVVWLASLVQVQSAILSELIDDRTRASEQFREAFRTSPASRFDCGANATSRLALSFARLGALHQSIGWRAISDWAGASPTHAPGRIRRINLLTDATLAIAQLDHDRARAALTALGTDLDTNEYAPFVVEARTNYQLAWGDTTAVAAYLAQVRVRAAKLQHPSAGDRGVAGPLLTAAQANLLLALGRGNDARAVLDGRFAEHPMLDEPRARFALLTGDDQRARDLALRAAERPVGVSPVQRIALILIIAVASHRLGRRADASEALRRATHEARAQMVLQPFSRLPHDDLLAIAAYVPEAADLLDDQRLLQTSAVNAVPVRLVSLSVRERVVLELISHGLPEAQVAQTLIVSINTVRSQRRSLYQKLGATSRAQALDAAANLGLI